MNTQTDIVMAVGFQEQKDSMQQTTKPQNWSRNSAFSAQFTLKYILS
jgi:hypothetical protein